MKQWCEVQRRKGFQILGPGFVAGLCLSGWHDGVRGGVLKRVVRAINTFFTLLFIDSLQIRVRMEGWNDSKMRMSPETTLCLLLKGIPALE